MRDMNIAKLTSVDVPLFNAIVQDLFPSVELPTVDYGKVPTLAPPPDLTCALAGLALGFRASSCRPRAVTVCGSAALSGPPCLRNGLDLFKTLHLWLEMEIPHPRCSRPLPLWCPQSPSCLFYTHRPLLPCQSSGIEGVGRRILGSSRNSRKFYRNFLLWGSGGSDTRKDPSPLKPLKC